ncbi:MAG: hypothetical protein QOE14_1598, partial [Humisphaera sp.]|nr:hypothetical protein [Humisphaera sp.]
VVVVVYLQAGIRVIVVDVGIADDFSAADAIVRPGRRHAAAARADADDARIDVAAAVGPGPGLVSADARLARIGARARQLAAEMTLDRLLVRLTLARLR